MKLSLAVLLLSILAAIAFVEALPAAAPLEDAAGFCRRYPRICEFIKILNTVDQPLIY
uniref:Uncharacterized protein n=1 Tax=Anopheles albimanus TaxID=7167 RepID=A0A2C9GGU6_ANOAL